MRNSMITVVTLVGLSIPAILTGTLIIEQIFSLPGLGTYIIQAINDKDIPEIQGVVLVVATAFVIINLLVDVVYAYLDPRIARS